VQVQRDTRAQPRHAHLQVGAHPHRHQQPQQQQAPQQHPRLGPTVPRPRHAQVHPRGGIGPPLAVGARRHLHRVRTGHQPAQLHPAGLHRGPPRPAVHPHAVAQQRWRAPRRRHIAQTHAGPRRRQRHVPPPHHLPVHAQLLDEHARGPLRPPTALGGDRGQPAVMSDPQLTVGLLGDVERARDQVTQPRRQLLLHDPARRQVWPIGLGPPPTHTVPSRASITRRTSGSARPSGHAATSSGGPSARVRNRPRRRGDGGDRRASSGPSPPRAP
jgi:hypothetical protein